MVKYPEMRNELIEHLRVLSDPDYQERVWVRKDMPEGRDFDDFDLIVHFFFDDTDLGDDAKATIGWFVENEIESSLVSRVADAIDSVLQKHGHDLADSEYMACKEWEEVMKAAKDAAAVIKNA